jgi:hypothetical protein
LKNIAIIALLNIKFPTGINKNILPINVSSAYPGGCWIPRKLKAIIVSGLSPAM